jgi:Fur family peroxide stress response transcriptional regulator
MEPESEEIESLSKNGFQIEETHHYYKGICPECREKNHEN